NTYHIDSGLLLRIPPIQVNSILPEPGRNQVWFATINGLYQYDSRYKKKSLERYNVLIREFRVNNQTFYLNSSGITNKKSKIYETRSSGVVGFRFASPFFESESRTTFSWLLEGYDNDWSQWSKKSMKNYFDLSPGFYTFKVRAKNLYGNISKADDYQLRILAPWYRTWWAICLIIAVVLIFIVMFTKIRRTKRIEKENIRLEALVRERTSQITQQNAQLEIKTRQLEIKTRQLEEQSEQLHELDQVKSRFFTNISHEFRTPLTLIINPIETMMDQDTDKSRRKKYKIILNSAHRL
ncbi:MAG: hypothetical protein GY757_47060, partial [bacterium]|nr:hypothetical protein [bacterium]